MVHRKDPEAVRLNGSRPPWIERPIASRKCAPRSASETCHDPWSSERELKVEVRSACGDLRAVRIAVTSLRVARITAHKVGDKDALKAGTTNHPAEQIARAVTAKRDARAIAAEAPGR